MKYHEATLKIQQVGIRSSKVKCCAKTSCFACVEERPRYIHTTDTVPVTQNHKRESRNISRQLYNHNQDRVEHVML